MTMPKPSGWQFVPLGQVIASAQSGFASGARDPNGVIQMRMNNVTTDGSLDWTSFIRVPATPKQLAKYRLQSGDVLFNATNSPELVGKTTAFSGHAEPVVFSNHFVRLRVDDKRLDPWYLARWLTHQQQRRVFESLCTQWVNQASVRKDDLFSLRIPLPPLPEQKRIAAILAKADRLRRLRRTARDLSDTYLQSVFLEMFGDPVSNPMGWEVTTLRKVASINRGKFSPRPRNDPRYYGGSYPFIQTGDIAKSNGFLTEWAQTLNEEGTRVSRAFDVGTVVIAIVGATIGETAVLGIRAYCPDSVIGIEVDPNSSSPEYIEHLLRFWKPIFRARAPETARANINLETLRPVPVPLPPLPLQQRFTQVVHKSERLRAQQREAQRQAEHLFQTLLHRAFRGELGDPKGLGDP